MISVAFLALTALAGVAVAQNSTSAGNHTAGYCSGNLQLDSGSLDNAAAWGVAGNITMFDDNGKVDDATWSLAYAVWPDGSWNTSLLAPPGRPLPDANSSSSLCTIVMEPPVNTNERGQSDNGSCFSMYDETCVKDLKSWAEGAANSIWLSSPYLADYKLANFCNSVSASVFNWTQRTDTSCSKYFKSSGASDDGLSTITTLKNSPTDNITTCHATSDKVAPGYTFSPIVGGTGYWQLSSIFGKNNATADYDSVFRAAMSVMLIELPPNRTVFNGGTNYIVPTPDLVCTRVTNVREGATTPSALPAPSDARVLSPRMAVMVSGWVVALVSVFALGGNSIF